MAKKQSTEHQAEIRAMSAVLGALEGLSSEAQSRVLHYVAGMLNVDMEAGLVADSSPRRAPSAREFEAAAMASPTERSAGTEEGFEGISPVARKWIARNGLRAEALGAIFSLGGDEIELVAKTIPGTSKRDRMHSVVLLMGVASYLDGGAARFSHEKLKEACLHYKAYDANNFAAYLKGFSAEVTGDKSTMYALTARGMASATDMVKGLTGMNNTEVR